MEWALIGSLIAGTAAAAQTQRNSGKMADIQYREQAQQETDAARDREIDRRRRLVSALASQNAEAGALGVTPGVGSRAALVLSDAKRARYENLADRAGTGRRALVLRSAGRNARKQGDLAAASSLLGGSADILEAWPR